MPTIATPKGRSIAKTIATPMSQDDIRALLPGCPVWMYSQFADMKSIGEAVGDRGYCCYLVMTSESYGHWCAVLRHSTPRGSVYEVFDSYGDIPPDDELDFVPAAMKVKLNETQSHLSRLLQGKTVVWNKHNLQSWAKGTATCGRWCCSRILNRDVSIRLFARGIWEAAKAADVTPDQVVVVATT